MLLNDRIEELCHRESSRDFFTACIRLEYDDLVSLQAELSSRIAVIDSQIKHRISGSPEWRQKAERARDAMRYKRSIAADRIASIRSLSLASVLARKGRDISASGHLAMIKFLVGLFESHADQATLAPDELAAFDACRVASGCGPWPKFSSFDYDPATGRILSGLDNTEVARVTSAGCDRDDVGFLLAASADLLSLLSRYRDNPEVNAIVSRLS